LADEERRGGFMPPQPAGPEPELGAAPPPPAPGQAPPQYAAAPQGAPAHGHGGFAPPGQGYPPQPQWGAQPWGYQQQVPDNTPAIVGFVLSLVSAGLLLISGGLSSLISVGCAIAAIIYGHKGRKKVDAGETPRHRGLAQAGFVIGIVSLVLSVIATSFQMLLLVLALTDEDVRNDLEREFDQSDTIRAAASLVLAAGRLGLHLFA
jgi:hypothetical protein